MWGYLRGSGELHAFLHVTHEVRGQPGCLRAWASQGVGEKGGKVTAWAGVGLKAVASSGPLSGPRRQTREHHTRGHSGVATHAHFPYFLNLFSSYKAQKANEEVEHDTPGSKMTHLATQVWPPSPSSASRASHLFVKLK